MVNKFKIFSFVLSFSLIAPCFAFAADAGIDARIKELDAEIAKLEYEYKGFDEVFDKASQSSKAYIDEYGNFVPHDKAVMENLLKVSSKLDEFVDNVVPSLEQPMLCVYFGSGAKVNGFNIRKNNANDLYSYLKKHFVMKKGKDKAEYDSLLREYVNAISDSVLLPDLSKVTDSLYGQMTKRKEKLDKARALRRYYKREKYADVIKRLEDAISESEATVKSCRQLMEYSPKTIAGVRGKLERMLADQEALIVRSKRALSRFVDGL